jgi:hypothetical protein
VAAGSSQTSGGPEIEGQRFEAGVDDRAVLGRAAHHRRPHEKARLECLGRGAVAVEVAAVIGVHEDVRAALQFGVDAARRFELEGAGAGPRAAPPNWEVSISPVGLGLATFGNERSRLGRSPRLMCRAGRRARDQAKRRIF